MSSGDDLASFAFPEHTNLLFFANERWSTTNGVDVSVSFIVCTYDLNCCMHGVRWVSWLGSAFI